MALTGLPDAAATPATSRPRAPCFVAELAPAKVIGDVRLVATSADIVLGDVQALHGVRVPEHHWVYRRRRFRYPRRLCSTAVLLASAAGNNYFHWLFDSLPRLHLLALAGWELRGTDWVLLNESLQPFHEQSLDQLGIVPERRRRCAKGNLLEIDRLVVPSMPAPPGTCPAWACQFLRRLFLSNETANARRRIYVSRRFARRRRLENDEEIATLLARRGFQVVFPEGLTFGEQVALFSSVSTVVAVHGAALANLVFAPPGTNVLEIFSPSYRNKCYQELAITQRLPYQSFTAGAGRRRVKHSEDADLRVDPGELRRKLAALQL